jgi:hypothetical protein
MLYDMERNDSKAVSILFDIGMAGSSAVMNTSYLLCLTSVSKLVRPETRGSIFFLGAMIKASAILIL